MINSQFAACFPGADDESANVGESSGFILRPSTMWVVAMMTLEGHELGRLNIT
jgi:hypothetical protein